MRRRDLLRHVKDDRRYAITLDFELDTLDVRTTWGPYESKKPIDLPGCIGRRNVRVRSVLSRVDDKHGT
jgi:hypothetical protein